MDEARMLFEMPAWMASPTVRSSGVVVISAEGSVKISNAGNGLVCRSLPGMGVVPSGTDGNGAGTSAETGDEKRRKADKKSSGVRRGPRQKKDAPSSLNPSLV